MIQDEERLPDISSLFLYQGEDGLNAYKRAIDVTKEELLRLYGNSVKPYSGKSPQQVEDDVKKIGPISETGESLTDVVEELGTYVLPNSILVTHPKSIAHLHCPPLIPALAAEMMISALNQSMDSWDQSAAATHLEEEMIRWLCETFGFSGEADGTFTSGGTQSNYMGLLLARDAFCHEHWNWDVQQDGLPREAYRLRILCSEDAHFTVKKSASQLGLGEKSVVLVKADNTRRLCMEDLQKKLERLQQENLLPFAIVATCGTTDFGSIDPLQDIASIAREHKLWFHVDAAYGGALRLSRSLFGKIQGIELADSVTVDFHKLFYQPISCGAFLVRDRTNFRFINYHAAYLNPEKDEEEGMPHLVNKSVQTTRRFDALKLFVSLKVIGTKRFGEMIDYTCELAQAAADTICAMENLIVLNKQPELNAVVFRYQTPYGKEEDMNKVNQLIHQTLLHSGSGIIARTSIEGKAYLKFTLLNPRTTIRDIKDLLDEIQKLGDMYTTNRG
ncbi:pyridoxal phosphate-dependent decarboxylase family protein [Aneurinibacillus migulanus]|uniref:pyridoxal phosphate-dependent decarboxylase family protein n=1 Tax=Aneurinibacillus migulanus TaxID=47500 RepID=UPI0020A0A5FA|nr:aspartate aminotransferase family protein [Aneurinibacillus migulanus]MCP1356495.1 aspartate aminotransferase family protein [Aneurinibacillus migulanus]MED4731320.1 aspartate aminotransferase family protein [Aneurinibacillus migulanus]